MLTKFVLGLTLPPSALGTTPELLLPRSPSSRGISRSSEFSISRHTCSRSSCRCSGGFLLDFTVLLSRRLVAASSVVPTEQHKLVDLAFAARLCTHRCPHRRWSCRLICGAMVIGREQWAKGRVRETSHYPLAFPLRTPPGVSRSRGTDRCI